MANVLSRAALLVNKRQEVRAMAEWNPLQEVEALWREIDRAFQGFSFGEGLSLPELLFCPDNGRDDTR
jgi:hypothetical protein